MLLGAESIAFGVQEHSWFLLHGWLLLLGWFQLHDTSRPYIWGNYIWFR